MCYQAELGRSAVKDVWKIQENPKICERWNTAQLRWEAWLTPRYMPSIHSVTVKFVSSVTKGVHRIRRRLPKLWSTGTPPLPMLVITSNSEGNPQNCGSGVGGPLEIHLSPHVNYPAEFCRSMSNGISVIKKIHLKKIIHRVLPFKVT